jgi:hypothetical protein
VHCRLRFRKQISPISLNRRLREYETVPRILPAEKCLGKQFDVNDLGNSRFASTIDTLWATFDQRTMVAQTEYISSSGLRQIPI